MMLHTNISGSFANVEESHSGRPASAFGTTVTPANGSKGSWVELIASTSFDSFGILINVNTHNGNATSRSTVLDIGIGAASSEVVLIADLLCGNASSHTNSVGGFWYWFPIFIPAGTRIAARAQSTGTDTLNCFIRLSQKPRNPLNCKFGSFVETVGITAPNGVSITPGTTGEGAWTSAGTTAKEWFCAQIGFQISSTDTGHQGNTIELDVAIGDGTNFDILLVSVVFMVSGGELNGLTSWPGNMNRRIPAGSTIYARARSSGALDTVTFAIYGVG